MEPPKTEDEQELEQLKKSLPTELWFDTEQMYLYQGFWCSYLEPTISLQKHFKAKESDILVASFRKTGTTWLKALIYSICNRQNYGNCESALLNQNPHGLVPQLESNIYAKSKCPDFSNIKSPRLFGTHIPYNSLPDSLKQSKCKVIYIGRNPLDTFISSWFFYLKAERNKSVTPDMMEEYFEKFCKGECPYGPFEDQVLQYWNASMEWPDKVLFIKYEDLKTDTKMHLKRMAEFVGFPFSVEEENQGIVDAIIELCSIGKLKEAEVNKSGMFLNLVQFKYFFRKGDVGDWVNYLTPAMAERLQSLTEEKFKGTGLSFSSWYRMPIPLGE